MSVGRTRRPLVGVLCCNEWSDRPVQTVASRFIEPIARYADASVVLIPALPEALDADGLADRLDGLLLTGSRSNVMPTRYGGDCSAHRLFDERRDAVALRLSERMIEGGRPVFGICRGLQELNVLFGGTLTCGLIDHHRGSDHDYVDLFAHEHDVDLSTGSVFADGGHDRITVNSVHLEGIDRLGSGLQVEATASDDGLIEAFSGNGNGAPVLAVQWHPEWDIDRNPHGQRYFSLLGATLRGGSLTSVGP